MATGALAALTVSLGLDAGEFTSGLSKAQYQLAQLNQSIQGFGNTAQRAFELVGIGAGIAGIIKFGEATIQAAESIRNLAVDTGSSVEEISRLSNIANISGVSFDTFQTAILRLGAGLNGSEEGSTKTAQALQFLGISSRDPAAALQEVADKLAKYADGSSKAAIARDLFGRGGAAFLSTLKDISSATDVTNTLTAKQADEAANLAEQFRHLEVESTGLKNAFLNDVVPAANQVVTALLEARKAAGGGFFDSLIAAAPGLNPFGDINKSLEQTRTNIDETQKKIDAAKSQIAAPDQNSGLLSSLTKDYHPDATLAVEQKNLSVEQQRLAVLKAVQVASLGDLNDPKNFDARDIRARQLPNLNYNSNSGKDDPTKALLDAANKALQADVAQETELLQARNDVLGKLYGVNLLSIQDYYHARETASDDALTAQLSDYAQEIKNQQDFIAKSTTSQVAKAKALGDISDIEKKADAAVATNRKSQLDGFFEQIAAVKAYQNSLVDLSAQLLVYAGNSAAAAGITFDVSKQQIRERLQIQLNADGEQQLALLRAQAVAQAALNDVQKAGSTLFDVIGTAQARIDLAVQTGNETDLQAYADKTALAQKYIDQLNKIADAAALAAVTPEQLQGVDNFRLKIEQLSASTDALAQKFRGAFEDSFSSALDSVINRTKTVKEAITDFTTSITASIAHVATTDIAQKLFGKDGPLGDLSDGLSKLFGGASQTTANAGISSLGTAALAATPSLDSLTLAATSAAQALLAVAASSGASAIPGFSGFTGISTAGDIGADIYDFGGAAGGSSNAGGLMLVGEQGPEMLKLPSGSQILPNNKLKSALGQPQNTYYGPTVINVPKNTSRSTADQMAVSYGREQSRARARNG